ncbi:hypothetical protein BD408DRAFT_483439 [Parasitella parasitica]|nr:hypothetical protein BD408DRAFT_483439 [Parasitella parasitica]
MTSRQISLLQTTVKDACITVDPVTADFYRAITTLHQDGCLQHLNSVTLPAVKDAVSPELLANYNDAMMEFRKSIKSILVISLTTRATANQLLAPDRLIEFTNLESWYFLELASLFMYELGSLIPKNSLRLESIVIEIMNKFPDTNLPSIQYKVDPSNYAQHQATNLELIISGSVTADEMIYISRSFPSLQTFRRSSSIPKGLSNTTNDMKAVYQFFGYLFTIPKVYLQEVSLALADTYKILGYIETSIHVKTLVLAISHSTRQEDAVIFLEHELKPLKSAATGGVKLETEYCLVDLSLVSSNVESAFTKSLKIFKDSVSTLVIGLDEDVDDTRFFQQIHQDSIDYIVENYSLLKHLCFEFVDFPTEVSYSSSQRKLNLETLSIAYCRVNTKYYNLLTSQIDQVELFHHKESANNNHSANIMINMQYTRFSTINLQYHHLDSYIIKVWINSQPILFKTSAWDGIARLSTDDESMSGERKITICCRNVREIRTEHGSLFVT